MISTARQAEQVDDAIGGVVSGRPCSIRRDHGDPSSSSGGAATAVESNVVRTQVERCRQSHLKVCGLQLLTLVDVIVGVVPPPTHKQLAEQHGISVGAAHRVTALLRSEGLVDVSRGRRATVVRRPLVNADQGPPTADGAAAEGASKLSDDRPLKNGSERTLMASPQLWAITVRGPDGRRYPVRHVCEDINRPDSFRSHLLAVARIERPMDTDRGESWIGDYELEIREPSKEHEDPKFTLRWQTQ